MYFTLYCAVDGPMPRAMTHEGERPKQTRKKNESTSPFAYARLLSKYHYTGIMPGTKYQEIGLVCLI